MEILRVQVQARGDSVNVLRLQIFAREQERESRLAALDASITRGLADAEAGRVKPAAEVFDRLEAKYRAMAEARGQ